MHTESLDNYIWRAHQVMGPFNFQSILKYSEYEPEVPSYIINNLTNKTDELPMVKNTKNKSLKNKSKKQNIMKKSFKNIGKGIAKGTCKVLGGAHLVIQSTADVVCATEAGIRAVVFHEDKLKAIEDRKIKTAQYQMNIALKGLEIQSKAQAKIDSIKFKKEPKKELVHEA